MRIIIELDGNNPPEIKKSYPGEGEQPGTYLTGTTSAPIDAGFASIPEPESFLVPENEITENSMRAVSDGNDTPGIDAGGYNANSSDTEINMAVSTHQTELASAVSSGSAMDAGTANIEGGTFTSETVSQQDSGDIIFDRSNAIDAGAFTNTETADII